VLLLEALIHFLGARVTKKLTDPFYWRGRAYLEFTEIAYRLPTTQVSPTVDLGKLLIALQTAVEIDWFLVPDLCQLTFIESGALAEPLGGYAQDLVENSCEAFFTPSTPGRLLKGIFYTRVHRFVVVLLLLLKRLVKLRGHRDVSIVAGEVK